MSLWAWLTGREAPAAATRDPYAALVEHLKEEITYLRDQIRESKVVEERQREEILSLTAGRARSEIEWYRLNREKAASGVPAPAPLRSPQAEGMSPWDASLYASGNLIPRDLADQEREEVRRRAPEIRPEDLEDDDLEVAARLREEETLARARERADQLGAP